MRYVVTRGANSPVALTRYTVSTVVPSRWFISNTVDQRPLLFRAICTRRTVCFKRSTCYRRNAAAVPLRSSTSPVYYLPAATSQARNILTHALAFARGKTARFHAKKTTTRRRRVDTTLRTLRMRVSAKLSAGERHTVLLKTRGIEETKERETERA